ncbi:peptidase associated/transthyretin-like domain-containing protein [Sediminitomix flava]|uniref:Carboxypeptidase-like protein n=1 Tax=Sediminitomix flava TaxID=379075 RepID=A0A315ZTR2_SEDFL|nr:hypothetical protein [Sediminitomix flava]PWJ38624.1 hypothetical protein BC781_107214 [Sediminitomix flava]
MRRNINYITLVIVGLFFYFPSFAQDQAKTDKLTVIVYEKETGRPLNRAHVLAGRTGAITKGDGRAEMLIKPVDSIQVSFQGYKTVKVALPEFEGKDHLFIKVPLSEMTVYLDEVDIFPFPETKEEFKATFLALKNMQTENQRWAMELKNNFKPFSNPQIVMSYRSNYQDPQEQYRIWMNIQKEPVGEGQNWRN